MTTVLLPWVVAVLVLATPPASVESLFTFEDDRIVESSGLLGARTPGVVWTVNDSGADARIHAVDDRGCTRLDAVLDGVEVRDVEDLARDEQGRLLVADVGDNRRVRAEVRLHAVEEPTVDLAGPCPSPAPTSVVPPVTRIVTLADGPADVEAVLVEPDGAVLLVTKVDRGATQVLAVGDDDVARVVADAGLPDGALVTGAATSPDGSRHVLRTYGQAHVFDRAASPAETFASASLVVDLPLQPQGETIAWPEDDRWLLSSEDPIGTRPPVLAVGVPDQAPAEPATPGPSVSAPTPADRSAAATPSPGPGAASSPPGGVAGPGTLALTVVLLLAVVLVVLVVRGRSRKRGT